MGDGERGIGECRYNMADGSVLFFGDDKAMEIFETLARHMILGGWTRHDEPDGWIRLRPPTGEAKAAEAAEEAPDGWQEPGP
jgi:hypothetical protein